MAEGEKTSGLSGLGDVSNDPGIAGIGTPEPIVDSGQRYPARDDLEGWRAHYREHGAEYAYKGAAEYAYKPWIGPAQRQAITERLTELGHYEDIGLAEESAAAAPQTQETRRILGMGSEPPEEAPLEPIATGEAAPPETRRVLGMGSEPPEEAPLEPIATGEAAPPETRRILGMGSEPPEEVPLEPIDIGESRGPETQRILGMGREPADQPDLMPLEASEPERATIGPGLSRIGEEPIISAAKGAGARAATRAGAGGAAGAIAETGIGFGLAQAGVELGGFILSQMAAPKGSIRELLTAEGRGMKEGPRDTSINSIIQALNRAGNLRSRM